MGKLNLTTGEARHNIQRLLALAKTDGYLTLDMTMVLLERSQMTAYTYLRHMVDEGMMLPDRRKRRWYLQGDMVPVHSDLAGFDAEGVVWPVRLFTPASRTSKARLPSWRDDELVAAICRPARRAA